MWGGLIRRESNKNSMNEEEIKTVVEEGKSIRRSKEAETQEQNGKNRSTNLNSVTVKSERSIPAAYR